MAYTPTLWVEDETRLGPTNLNKLEQGVASAHQLGTPEVWNPTGGPRIPVASAASWNDGQAASPKTDTSYLTPSLYIQRHSNSAHGPESSFSNAYLAAPIEVEVIAYAADIQSHSGLTTRVWTATPAPAGFTPGLVGVVGMAESHAPVGQKNRGVWGANFAAMADTGTAPDYLIGIEVDVVANSPMTLTNRPGIPPYQAYVGYMAQASGTYPGNSGVWVTSSDGLGGAGPGWRMGVQAESVFQSWAGFFRNTLNAAGAGGIHIESSRPLADTHVLECFSPYGEALRVDGDNLNPVWLKLGGTLYQQIQQPAGLAAGTGGFVANAGTAMNAASTSKGAAGAGSAAYTFGDIVQALKDLGLIVN